MFSAKMVNSIRALAVIFVSWLDKNKGLRTGEKGKKGNGKNWRKKKKN